MTSSRRTSPPWPTQVALFIGCALALSAAHAQAPAAFDAADPASPVVTPRLVLPRMGGADTPALPADIESARAIWQRANQRVAEFPRGHADLLRWESGQPADAQSKQPEGTPMAFAQALRLSLRHRPDLFTHAGMNPLARAKVQVAYASHVRDLQRAWIDAVVARQRERLLSEVLDATRTGSELGRRMVVAGNWSQARQLREQLVEAAAWQASVDARAASLSAQEHLASLLGIWNAGEVGQLGDRLPGSLPALPETPPSDAADTEAAVLRSHPTLAQARLLAARDAAALPAARRQAWAGAVDAALQALPDGGDTTTPPNIDNLSLLRDTTLERAVNAESELLQQATARRSMARQAWAAVQLRHTSALHAQNVIAQLQTALAQETQLRYNGMLQSTWDLLASARERMASLDAALQARRAYGLALADWQALLAGADTPAGTEAPSSSGTGATAAAPGH